MFKQHNESVAARRDVFFEMVDGGGEPLTGLTPAVAILKSGATAYTAIAGTVAECEFGTYVAHLAAADLDTLGSARLRMTATGALPDKRDIEVVRLMDDAHLTKAVLCNLRTHTVATGVDVIKDDDGVTTIKTITPSEAGGVVTITPS